MTCSAEKNSLKAPTVAEKLGESCLQIVHARGISETDGLGLASGRGEATEEPTEDRRLFSSSLSLADSFSQAGWSVSEAGGLTDVKNIVRI